LTSSFGAAVTTRPPQKASAVTAPPCASIVFASLSGRRLQTRTTPSSEADAAKLPSSSTVMDRRRSPCRPTSITCCPRSPLRGMRHESSFADCH